MIKRLLIIAIASAALLMGTTVYAQKPEKKGPKEPKLLKEKKFDKKIKKWAGNVVVTEDSIVFLDKDGNVKKTKKIKSPEQKDVHVNVRLSKKGKRIGQRTFFDITEKGASKVKYELMDEEGNVLWATDNMWGITYLSDEIDVVAELECEDGWCSRNVVFHDKQNPKGVKVTADVSPNAQSSGGYLSEDGKYFIAEFSIGDKSYEAALFDVINRKPLWVKKFENKKVHSVAVSPQGNFVFVPSRHKEKSARFFNIYSKNGELVLKCAAERKGAYRYSFDPEEKYAVAATGFGELYVFDLKNAKLLWKYFVGETNLSFLDVDYSSGYIAASVTTRNPKNPTDPSFPRYLYIFNLDGELLLKKKIVGHGFKRWLAEIYVRIKDDGRKILINLPDKLLEFENEFAK
jgi:WD40 repeat protein